MEITYTKQGDYLIPNLNLTKDKNSENISLGKYALLRLNYLKKSKRVLYDTLLFKNQLESHLKDIQKVAEQEFEILINELSKNTGATEELKAANQMKWVGLMNNVKNAAEEIILKRYIYNEGGIYNE